MTRKTFHRALGARAIAVLTVLAAVLTTAAPASAAFRTKLVSGHENLTADGDSYEPSVSANGRFVAFTSAAMNLSDADANAFNDVFVRDTREDTIIFVSRGDGLNGLGGQDDSFAPEISGNGRYVAFASYDELTPDDHPGKDVFVRDLREGRTTLVSRADGAAGAGADGDSTNPAISANGRYVAFESTAANLGSNSTAYSQVYVRDLVEGRTTLVSRMSGAAGDIGTDSSGQASISADGTRVAFSSKANNLTQIDNDNYTSVFVRNMATAETILVSRTSGEGPSGDSWSLTPDISANGRAVAFMSAARNLDPAADNSLYDVFVRDLRTKSTTLASRKGANGKAGNRDAMAPSISASGRRVAFESSARNLSDDDARAFADVFVRDLSERVTSLVSRRSGTAGKAGNNMSFDAGIAADGKTVAFASDASNLSAIDADGLRDVFVRGL